MEKSIDLECLSTLEASLNKPYDPVLVKQHIRNYGNFYNVKYEVPSSEIFYAAVVNSANLREICDSPKVKIYIAKSSPDNNNIGDFKFIIMGADVNGETALDNPAAAPNSDYMDDVCCKNPPPSAVDL